MSPATTKVFRKKPVEIESVSFEDFVKMMNEGFDSRFICDNKVDGVPWSGTVNGYHITHENDDCYIIETLEGTHNFTPEDMLIIGVKGEIYPCKKTIFELTYDEVES